MITRFRVKNYKCLGYVDFPLTPIHVIIGQNDSGKTSVLEAMCAMSKSTSCNNISEIFPGDWKGCELLNKSSDLNIIELDIFVDHIESDVNINLEYCLKLEVDESHIRCKVFAEFMNRYDSSGKIVESIVLSPKRTDISALANRMDYPSVSSERKTLIIVADELYRSTYLTFNPSIMSVASSFDVWRKFSMDTDGFGLPTLLDDILSYDPLLYMKIKEEFCDFFPQFKAVRIETEEGLKKQIDRSGSITFSKSIGKGLYFDTKSGTSIRAEQVSDGAILFLGFLALMYNPKPPKLIMIEEPEKGIYPKRLEEVIGMMRKLVENPGDRPVPQIVMTTHSPYFLSLFQPEEVTFLRREGGTGPVRAYPMRDAPHIHERLGNGSFYLGELWYNLTEEELFADG